jgi:hypothetical protein
MAEITRRQMLAMTTLVIGAPGLGVLRLNGRGLPFQASPAQTEPAAGPLPEWIHNNRTLIAEGYNPPFYPSFDFTPAKAVSIAGDLDCDSMRFPTASYYAHFPTRSGYPIHPDLKGDPMRENLTLLRQAGMKTIAYIPLNHPFMQVESKDTRYADWTRRYADGSPMITTHYGWGRFYEGCILSPIREMARALTAEVLDYDYDVMYFDGPYQGMDHRMDFCHCRHCQSAHEQRFGRPVPDQRTCSLDERMQYIAWMRDEVVTKFFRDLRTMIREKRDVPVLFNDTVLLAKMDWRSRAFPIVDGFMFEAANTPEEKLFNLLLGKSTGKVIWTYIGHHTEYNREHMSDQSVRGWYSYPVEGEELFLDGATATAAGVGCKYWGMQRFFYETERPIAFESGRLVKELFTFQKEHSALLRTLSTQPQVGILVGSQTINWYVGRRFVPSAYGNYYQGAFTLLKSLSIEPEPFLDWRMTAQQLARYAAVFVPNAACLSDAQCAMLRGYVESGGTLLATHLTSVADEFGRMRSDFGLADLFGASFLDGEPIEYPDLYLKHAEGGLIPQDPQIMRVRPTGGAVQATTWDRGNHRDLGPAVVTHRVGKGQSIYLASGQEAIYEETRMEPVRSYLASLLLPHLEAGQTYKMDFIPGVTPHYTASTDCIVLHLLADIGDKNHHLNARQRFFPAENVVVRLRVRGNVRAVSLMRSGAAAAFTRDGEWITVTVPRVLVYEAIRVDLA